MAVCDVCCLEMMDGVSCTCTQFKIGKRVFDRFTWSLDYPCPDCNTPQGGHHHPGCCKEYCPACGNQKLICGCKAKIVYSHQPLTR